MNTTEYFKRTIQAYVLVGVVILGCKEFVLHSTLLQRGLYGSLEISEASRNLKQGVTTYQGSANAMGILLLCEFDVVVNRHLAVQWFFYLDVLLLVVVDGLPIYHE